MGVALDWDWATGTGGNLSARERRHLIGVILRDMPQGLAAVLKYRMGRRGTGRSDLARLPAPQSALARRVEEFVRIALSPHVLAHSYRTYHLGAALAQRDGADIDEEVAYLAALLHDLHLESPTPGRCFAVTGAQRAELLLSEWGADDTLARTVAAAVTGHATPGSDHHLSDPAGFVLAGSLADIAGRRLDEVDPTWLAQLQREHPRCGLKKHLTASLRQEALAVPKGRIQLANRWAALPVLVRMAPYPE